MTYNDYLDSYDDLQHDWNSILIGNGASRAVSQIFTYSSLFSTACSASIARPLKHEEQEIFSKLTTSNFEQVLSALTTAILIGKVYGRDVSDLEKSHERIRNALIDAVHAVHLPWTKVGEDLLLKITEALSPYDYVYSTNYDLLLYWAIMQNPAEFIDYFFSPGSIFDLGNVDVRRDPTRVLFLHGALHLYKLQRGGTLKRSAGDSGNLLKDFGLPIPDYPEATPLFVTEGNSIDKQRSINSSDYLSFAFSQFSRNIGPLVIFGQELNPQFDQHLIHAIKSGPTDLVAVGIHAASTTSIAAKKSEWFSKLYPVEVLFFKSETHPLGQVPPVP